MGNAWTTLGADERALCRRTDAPKSYGRIYLTLEWLSRVSTYCEEISKQPGGKPQWREGRTNWATARG